jgi:hypothetical protein
MYGHKLPFLPFIRQVPLQMHIDIMTFDAVTERKTQRVCGDLPGNLTGNQN